MKWKYLVETESNPSTIEGTYYGDFAGAVEQVYKAVRAEEWDKNTVQVEITITPIRT